MKNRNQTENILIAIVVAAGILTGYALLSAWDFEEEQNDEAFYCEMVQAGAWPDFREMGDDCAREVSNHESNDNIR